MKSKAARTLAALFAVVLANGASASTVDLFTVGSTHPGGALDPYDNPIAGLPIVSWTQMLAAGPSVTTMLTILAEGVDGGAGAPGGGEFDGVYVNGVFVGYLTQQSFYSSAFNLRPGPGAIDGTTEETLSVFDVTSLLIAGLNTFEVRIDTSNWVNEIEVAALRTLQTIPEPASLPLAAGATALLGLVLRRGRARA